MVKEIEKMKKNREERRAKQLEILEEKEEKRNIDPGNPNWEFLCMIREYQETLEYHPLTDSDLVADHQITVRSNIFLQGSCNYKLNIVLFV